jgi:thiol:disulfide interchange protein DsbD
MGLTMGVVAAPCIGPVILGLLVYVGSQRDALLGFLLFFALGLGMGLPYVLLASAAGAIRRLPRSGEWLAWVNRLFGTLLLGMALYFLSPLLDDVVLRIAIPLYLAAAGLYLGFLERSARSMRWFALGRRAFGALTVLLAIWVALPSAQAREGIRWVPLSPDALTRARQTGRPTIIEFGADWCLPCIEMTRTTFVDPEVAREAERFATFMADVTESSPRNDELLARFGVVGVPTIIFYGAGGTEVDRLVGYVEAGRFLRTMRRVRGQSEGPPSRPDAGAPSLTRLREERRDVVAAHPGPAAADHVGAQRVDLELVADAQLAHQVVAARGHQ